MSDAMTGLNTANREGKPEEREQEILTPPRITNFVRAVFGGQIVLDPCAAVDGYGVPRGFVNAEMTYDGLFDDGRVAPWKDRTFVNPPFADLHVWLDKALYEERDPAVPRIAVLCPVRSNRVWWRNARNAARLTGAYIELNPFPFVGFEKGTIRQGGKKKGQVRTCDEVAPMAMCLMFFNVDYREVAIHLGSLGEILR